MRPNPSPPPHRTSSATPCAALHGLIGLDDPAGAIDPHQPGAKLDAGKPLARLIVHGMPRALLAIAEVATSGAAKYSEHGWQHVPRGVDRYTDAMLRHVLREGIESRDDESGLLHAAHAAWNALARLELLLRQAAADTTDRAGNQ